MDATHYISINGRRLYLVVDMERLVDAGEVRLNTGNETEQCEDCAADICETGSVSHMFHGVVCSCGCHYGLMAA